MTQTSEPATRITHFHTRWWHHESDKVVCTLCPRECHIPVGGRGFCFVRANVDGHLELTTYGRSSGFCIDPVEKKPLNHFLPGTPILSLGTAGCNLGCKFCQNWDISKSREMDTLAATAGPEAIVEAAVKANCRSIAFTYNDPTIWAEYAIDIAKVARQRGIKTVAVTAGYISSPAREEFYHWMDAANVDLKAFTETFYRKLTQTSLQPVLDTLVYLKKQTSVWFEITNLMIPGENDSPDETRQMCDWIVKELGPDVPVHFTAFHPDFRMLDKSPTPPDTLARARQIALDCGIQYAYVGNINDVERQSTYCPGCRRRVIQRDWYELGEYHLKGNRCEHCGTPVAGVFEPDATRPGDWGRKRARLQIVDGGRQFVNLSSSMSTTTPKSEPVAPVQVPAPQRIAGFRIDTRAVMTQFTEPQQRALMRYARAVLDAAVHGQPCKATLAPELHDAPAYGLFLTIKRAGNMRACRGRWGMGDDGKLGPLLAGVTADSALQDTRFPAICAQELPFLALDLSVMYDPQVMQQSGEDRINALNIGEHGLVIAHPRGRGLLLPQVPIEHGWDAKTFLDRVCHKANLPPDTWRRDPEAQLMTFRAQVLECEPPAQEFDVLGMHANRRHKLLTLINLLLRDEPHDGAADDELLQQKWTEELGLYLQTPSGLTAAAMGAGNSLVQLAQIAVQSLKNVCAQRRAELEPVHKLHVMWHPIRLRPHDYPNRHQALTQQAVLVRHQSRWSLIMPNGQGASDTVGDALRSLQMSAGHWREHHQRDPMAVRVTAFNLLPFEARQRPSGIVVRHPARAGQFYPGNAEELQQALDRHVAAANGTQPQTCRAAMLPHAGWRFCGDIIAKTLARVDVPDLVIVLGPKHTPHGPRWSVPPHQRWEYPGASVNIDTDVVHRLIELIPGLQCEAAAHHQEHGTEVLLPFLQRRNPNVRVVPMVLGMTGYAALEPVADALAQITLENPKSPPLLIISSDLNHYATDEENRRLDRMALDAMIGGDPDALYRTCIQHHISMCGVLPACAVMAALRQATPGIKPQLVDYNTSAAVSGDTSRVVGYAGVTIA